MLLCVDNMADKTVSEWMIVCDNIILKYMYTMKIWLGEKRGIRSKIILLIYKSSSKISDKF